MRAISAKVILFNAGAILAAAGALIGLGRSILFPPTMAPCSDRTTSSTAFPLERNGSVLTATDILARTGNSSVGVIENVEVVRPRNTRIPAAMRVSLRTASPGGGEATSAMAFPWQPRSVQEKAAVCLSYSIFLFADLEFQAGGVLPGLQGQDRSQETRDGFVALLGWRPDGQPVANLAVTSNGEAQATRIEAQAAALPRGQWIKIDQEVVLNSPGRDDGTLRLWVDGRLAIDRANVAYRTKAAVGIAGAAVNVSYGTPDKAAFAQSDTKIWLSPLEMSWQ
jgi:hypothetical protein